MFQLPLMCAVLALAFLGAPADKPKAPPKSKPKPASPSCKLLTPEAPRGGRIDVEEYGLSKVPLVRIGGTVTRIIERRGNVIAAQVPRNSDGGVVSIKSGKREAVCGSLTIIGKDRP